MPTEFKYEVPGAIQTYLTTELNSLADGANKLGAKIDNVADGENELFIALELTIATQGSARSANARVEIYLLNSVDDTNFCFGDDSTDPPSGTLIAVLELDAATTARIVNIAGLRINPFDFKLLVMNETGQALAASGNILKYRLYSLESQ